MTACTSPTTAKSVASPIAITARARVIQSGKGALATTARSVANGNRKYASSFSPACRSCVQKSESAAIAKKAIAGTAMSGGTGRSSRPRSALQASASAAAPSTA